MRIVSHNPLYLLAGLAAAFLVWMLQLPDEPNTPVRTVVKVHSVVHAFAVPPDPAL